MDVFGYPGDIGRRSTTKRIIYSQARQDPTWTQFGGKNLYCGIGLAEVTLEAGHWFYHFIYATPRDTSGHKNFCCTFCCNARGITQKLGFHRALKTYNIRLQSSNVTVDSVTSSGLCSIIYQSMTMYLCQHYA